MNVKLIPSTIFAVFLLAGRAGAQKPSAPKLEAGAKAPAIKVGGWAKGAPVTKLAADKLYVVEFWATWCGPCRMSIPHLTELAKKYKGKATIVGVSVWEQGADIPGQVKKFVAAEGKTMDYHVAYDTKAGTMAKTWMQAAGQDGIPTAFIIKSRKIVWIGNPLEGIEDALGEIVAGDYSPARMAVAVAASEKATKAAFDDLTKEYSAATAAKQYQKALDLIGAYSAKHPDQEMSLDLFKLGALMNIDEAKGLAFADAKAPTNMNIYVVLIKGLSDGDGGSMKPDPPMAVKYAKKFDESSEGHNFYSKSMLVEAYEANDEKGLALSAAKEALALGKKEGFSKVQLQGLEQYVSHFGLDDRLPGDPALPLNVAGWAKGGPITDFEPGKIYVVDFLGSDTTAWTKTRLEQLSGFNTKYQGKVTFIGVASGFDPTELGKGARQFIAAQGDKVNFPVAFDSDVDGMWRAWVGDYHVVPLRTFIISDGKLMWCGAFVDQLDQALGQILAGKFDIEGSKSDFAAAIEEAKLIYSMGEEPRKVLGLLDDFVARYPGHADDGTIGMMKVNALLHSDKSKAVVYIESDGPKCFAIYSEAARDLLRNEEGFKADPRQAVVYARKAADGFKRDWSSVELLGDTYAANGQKELATEAYKEALKGARAAGAPDEELTKLAALAK